MPNTTGAGANAYDHQSAHNEPVFGLFPHPLARPTSTEENQDAILPHESVPKIRQILGGTNRHFLNRLPPVSTDIEPDGEVKTWFSSNQIKSLLSKTGETCSAAC